MCISESITTHSPLPHNGNLILNNFLPIPKLLNFPPLPIHLNFKLIAQHLGRMFKRNLLINFKLINLIFQESNLILFPRIHIHKLMIFNQNLIDSRLRIKYYLLFIY